MADSQPPPIYSQEDPTVIAVARQNGQNGANLPLAPQILILPTVDAIHFQNGFLGVDNERAAIEGEIQIKDIDRSQWSKLTITLRSFEEAYHQEIELNTREVVLHTFESGSLLASTFPFSIPIPPDTPQSILTPHSSLAHCLTATLHPSYAHAIPITQSVAVYTKRYTSHTHILPLSPEVHSLDDPMHVEVQVPRATFKIGEPLPIYITVPPPPRELVVDQGLRIRNVRVELVRVINVKREPFEGGGHDLNFDGLSRIAAAEERIGISNGIHGSSELNAPIQQDPAKAPLSPSSPESSFQNVIARSGASCRFHSSKPIRLRFVLHPHLTSRSPSTSQHPLPGSDCSEIASEADIALITQTTLLHAVNFFLHVQVSFLDTKRQSERISSLKIPLIILPPPARLPEVSQTLDEAYSKKHDRPPVKTNRYDDSERAAPRYFECEAGPSMPASTAPPPFEERDAPPPFSTSAAEASTSTGLPTFLESEREIFIPDSELSSLIPPAPLSPAIEGEGVYFGFRAMDQFDGHSEDMRRLMTPPPSMEMAAGDTDLTALTEIGEPSQAMEALTLVLEPHEDSLISEEQPPPPPPVMDDPSDPPPSIDDSAYTRPDELEYVSPSPSPPPPIPDYHEEPPILPLPSRSSPSGNIPTTPGHAPPPYAIPDTHHDQENVMRPPPYVD